MSVSINQDVLMGKWKQIRGQIKQRWGKLTDNQLEQISGKYDELVGAVQMQYGLTREKAGEQVDSFLKDMKQRFGN